MSEMYLKNLECHCVKGVEGTCPMGGFINATMTAEANLFASPEANVELSVGADRTRSVSADLEFLSELPAKISAVLPLDLPSVTAEGEITDDMIADYAVQQNVDTDSELNVTYTDKIAGEFGDFYCIEKLYPSGDLAVDEGFASFVGGGVNDDVEELYTLINEGVYQGKMEDRGDNVNISDDEATFIHPDTINTEGFFQYQCDVTDFQHRPENTAFRIRVSAPLQNYESKLAPLYTIYNIKFTDPSGSLIVKYNDIQLKGDAGEHPNYATYSSLPQVNNTDIYDWDRRGVLHLHEVSGYTLSFNVRAVSLDDPFDPGFDIGFEENYITPELLTDEDGNNYLALDGSPLATQEQKFINPTDNFRISAVEICNSGGIGPRPEDYMPFYAQVREKGLRLERSIYPTFLAPSGFDTSIYPSTETVWNDEVTSFGSALGVTNEDECGAKALADILGQTDDKRYIKLKYNEGGGVADSGKLVLRFGGCFSDVDEISPGAFNTAFDQGASGDSRWWSPSGSFNTENRREDIQRDAIFYDVETLTLKVYAKKEIGSRDYALDVVGYSDDKLLAVTPASGGFIQDPSGVLLNDLFIPHTGQHPVLSGFYGDDLAMSEQSLSEMEDYFESSGNDHYKLAQYPMVTGTDFELYEIPLKILDDDVRLGMSRDYSMSSYLEKIYLDIFPLPSGASIAYTELSMRYAPSNAVNIYTMGGEKIGKVQDGREEGSLYPKQMGAVDDILNAGPGYGPLSSLSTTPHFYSSDETIKTNYSRRWRGVEGTVRGPYAPSAFGFGFENPVMEFPFVSGYYKFDRFDDNPVWLLSYNYNDAELGQTSGEFVTSPTVYQNLGWRYIEDDGTNGLFQTQLPGYTGVIKTSDWTSLTDGTTDFVGNPMYGKIADAFDRVVRVSQDSQNVTFRDVDVSTSGFSVFLRFTPDNTVSGVGYDLFDSGVLFSRWSTPADMDFVLGYSNGYLQGYAQDKLGNIIKVTDTETYDQYTYPLSVLLTYTDDKKLRLYTDNEYAQDGWNVLRATSATFDRNTVDTDIVLGWSAGSGVGMNMLVSEFGISSGNIVDYKVNANESKQVNADKFLENVRVQYADDGFDPDEDRHRLWTRVDDNTYSDWSIGDFKYCQFGPAFEQWQLRPNREQIVFDIKHDGVGYSQYVDSEPALIDSDVAYHTQVENDFLRFHLTDAADNFYAINRRITKNIPCSYKFSERALVVETVVEHKLGDDIKWSGCNDIVPSGPRMIVSLYTKAQEPYWTTDEPNWGLVNRKIHYLEPSSCLMRIDSTFDYESLCDETEQWANFPQEPRIKDFKERYFTDDVNQMFVQYDLVYPSGPAFDSKIYMHSSHVRMADANICASTNFDSGILYTSGSFPADGSINLNIGGNPTEENSSLSLGMNVPLPNDVLDSFPSGLSISISGANVAAQQLILWIPPQSGNQTFNLNVEGQTPPSGANNSINLAFPIPLDSIDSSDDTKVKTSLEGIGEFFGMPLTAYNPQIIQVPEGPTLSMNLLGSDETAFQSVLNSLVFNNQKLGGDANPILQFESADVSLSVFGSNKSESRRFTGSMPLFITNRSPSGALPLYLHNPRELAVDSGTMNLSTFSYGSDGSTVGLWTSNNYGVAILVSDNPLASLEADNEIRGVDLTGYGSCTGDSPSKAIDPPIVTDCTTWRDATCNEGGIFRAKDTYTNLDADPNFAGGVGYSGNYYGIRKYDELIPNAPYLTVMTIKTGDTDPINVPRTFEEWGYGMCGPEWDEDGCCTNDCDENLVFSGVKLVADDARGVPPSGDFFEDPELISSSGRASGVKYGTSVSVNGNLMGIGAPDLTIPDYDFYTNEFVDVSGAGAVFLYRRGDDVNGKKADWELLEQLMLPSGYRKDYIQKTAENLITFDTFSISGNQWQIGQEGRRFGESLDIASSGDREVVVVGAPRADWKRDFDDLSTSGVPSAAMIVADLFNYNIEQLNTVAAAAQKFNILWKYFSAPWNPGVDEWYAEINPKVLVFQLAFSDEDYPVVPTTESDWFIHKYIPRLDDLTLLLSVGADKVGEDATTAAKIQAAQPEVFNQMYSGVLDGFFRAFPREQVAVYSGVPAIMGMFKEESGSTASALTYNDATEGVKNLYDAFTDFYHEYSYLSGVRDKVLDIHQSGHLNTITGFSEDWAQTTVDLISDTFDSGRLSTTFTNETLNRNFIASGIGQEWGDTHGPITEEFQLPPGSGGRVFIFEKERDNFNCVQVIASDRAAGERDGSLSSYNLRLNDRFGHSVSVSDNGETVTIGSPWDQNPCIIMSRDQDEISRIYGSVRSWCLFANKTEAVAHYDDIALQSGNAAARTSTYDYLDAGERFAFRNDVNFWGSNLPTQYKRVFTYGHFDIQYTGTNQFLAQEFAPTSRLGWSTSSNEEGNICVFGAPTDSFNVFEDVNVWGDDTLNTWASYQHAGAVRVFEARNYYSHSGVVEFGIFGNLDRTEHKTERDAGYYDDQWELIFNSDGVQSSEFSQRPWRRTDFSELEIPRDAGLAFIITPEVDSASDEVIDNIKNWLALGDRNLVLVGNDPVWEDAGLYEDSNRVINKILEKLGSRMRIFAARDEAYSMQNCVSISQYDDNKYNITKALTPEGSVGATVGQGNYYAKGVGDIRIDLSKDGLEDYFDRFNCPEGDCCGECDPKPIVNSRCEFPLKHHGDLRAQWAEQCIKIDDATGKCEVVSYKRNWPQMFENFVVDCDSPPDTFFTRPYQEPVPVLTTAEHLPDIPWERPESSGKQCVNTPIFEWEVTEASELIEIWADNQEDEVAFSISEGVGSNFNSLFFEGDFINPDSLNGRDGILQGIGSSFYPEDQEREEDVLLSEESILAIVESGRFDNGDHNNSQIYLIATQWSENDQSRGKSGQGTTNEDKNTEFYINILRKDCTNAPKGIHLNSFTGRSSLSDAYYDSGTDEGDHSLGQDLQLEFVKNNNPSIPDAGGYFEEGQEISAINSSLDFVWVANPANPASESDITQLKNWLNTGNKKLIITYNAADIDTAQEKTQIIKDLCAELNMTSTPWFLPLEGEYFVTPNNTIRTYTSSPYQSVDYTTDAVSGCDNGYAFTFPSYVDGTSLSGVSFQSDNIQFNTEPKAKFVPISGGQDYQKIVWFDSDVIDKRTVYPNNVWKIDGEADIKFPTLEGTGYRLFINWVSETIYEGFDICGSIRGVERRPIDENGGNPNIPSTNYCGDIELDKTTVFKPQQAYYDIKATGEEITLNLNTFPWENIISDDLITEGVVPSTPRILSVSGCPLEITEVVNTVKTSGLKVIGYTSECEWIVSPAQNGVTPGESRPVKHESEIYCPDTFADECFDVEFGLTEIEDGPVVVAEEYENFSSFPNGRRRSKIIVISDSTMVQGQCPHYRSALSPNSDFIRSLYPPSPENYVGTQSSDGRLLGEQLPSNNSAGRPLSDGQVWEFVQKIRSPERGSPSKYFTASGIDANINMLRPALWGTFGGPVSPYDDPTFYIDNEDSYDPTTLVRPEEIIGEDKIEMKIEQWGEDQAKDSHGIFFRFSGDFLDIANYLSAGYTVYDDIPTLSFGEDDKNRGYILDAGIGGGMSELMRINNTDYLDFDIYYSGCVGDLFGYSVDISNNKLVVGSPFNAFVSSGTSVSGVVQWDEVSTVAPADREGIDVAEDGGAGAAFVFDRTGSGVNVLEGLLNWEFTQKIKPSSLNVGIYDFSLGPIQSLTNYRGEHNIEDPNFALDQGKRSDNFGISVSIACDMIAVGAPHHDYETLHHHIYSGSVDPEGFNTAFLRKDFDGQFDIPSHSFYDLGLSGVRVDQFLGASGTFILNGGAVFNYRNEMTNLKDRYQEWIFAEKLYSQGYKDRTQSEWVDVLGTPYIGPVGSASGTEADKFGYSVAIDRAIRGDSDYTLVAGAPFHDWPASGNHTSSGIADAGAAYTFDAMLRGQPPVFPSGGGWIQAHVFGNKKSSTSDDRVEIYVEQPANGDVLTYETGGIIFSNSNGDIFLEVSGFDASSAGFIAQRPYVEKITFQIIDGSGFNDSMTLNIAGEPVPVSGDMNLSLLGADQANVYNNIEMNVFGVTGYASGVPSGLFLITSAPSGPINEAMNLNVTSTQTTDSLDINIRGY